MEYCQSALSASGLPSVTELRRDGVNEMNGLGVMALQGPFSPVLLDYLAMGGDLFTRLGPAPTVLEFISLWPNMSMPTFFLSDLKPFPTLMRNGGDTAKALESWITRLHSLHDKFEKFCISLWGMISARRHVAICLVV
jgi:hypothetical protein